MAKKELVRLQKMMADCGVASRRKSEDLIRQGSVKVNGRVAVIGDKVDPINDKVFVKGKRIKGTAMPKKRYIMLHKPRGYVTTMSDEMGRKCVAELVSNIEERVYPVGRLDRDSEGMLLMTNDGEFANTVTHPKKDIYKVYRVTVRPSISDEQVTQMMMGMTIDGYKTKPCEVRIITRQEGRVVLEILLHEGRNRQIRKMCEQLGLEVARLKRTAIGTVKLGMLKTGDWRDLTQKEIDKLVANPNPSSHSI